MFTFKSVRISITSGTRYLQDKQLTNGSFLSFSSSDQTNFRGSIRLHTSFHTSLILSCLSFIGETPTIGKIKEKAFSYLMQQKNNYWSFNYWDRTSKEIKTMPYPDDLDDTFCALSAICQHKPEVIDGSALAQIVNLLLATEAAEGGPYYTWLVAKDAKKKWKDCDLAVNSNIAFFLKLQNINLPNLTIFIERALAAQKISSPYYPNEFALLYFISRFYTGEKKDIIASRLLEKKNKDGYWDNPLNTALAISTLFNIGVPANKFENAIAYLLQTQKNGHWQPYAFCIDPAQNEKTYYSGSDALTTAFCIEALIKFLTYNKISSRSVDKEKKQPKQLKTILSHVENRFLSYDKSVRNIVSELLQKLVEKDTTKQVPLLPYYFSQSLSEKNRKRISNNILVQLGIANTFGWIAYTIFDNFYDEEVDDLQSLSPAITSIRDATKIFDSISRISPEFSQIFQKIMDDMDNANAWESKNCRLQFSDNNSLSPKLKLPDYGQYKILAQKSLGHGLGPLAILYLLGYKKDSYEVTLLIKFLHHFLIAKQFNDDAYDWENDLRQGRLNPVNVMILAKWKENTKNKREVKLEKILPVLQEIFWEFIIEVICKKIDNHCNMARKALKQNKVIESYEYLEQFVEPVEQGAKQTVAKRKDMLAFLKTYPNH